MFVEITNGVDKFNVQLGAYNTIFKNQGYFIVGSEDVEETKDDVVEAGGGEDEKAAFLDELEEKPISQWNKEEVKTFCSYKGIDITGTKNVNEAKDVIKKFLEENE